MGTDTDLLHGVPLLITPVPQVVHAQHEARCGPAVVLQNVLSVGSEVATAALVFRRMCMRSAVRIAVRVILRVPANFTREDANSGLMQSVGEVVTALEVRKIWGPAAHTPQ